MRARGVVAAVMAVPAALAIAVAAHPAGLGPQVQHRPAVVQTVTSQAQPAPASSGTAAGKSHTVAKALAGHMVYHLVPHPYIFHRPYVFRIFRRRY